MKTVIIEDEIMAAQSLLKLVEQLCPDTENQAVLQSIEESVDWFGDNPMPDLVFMDIHLADGSAFAIFEQTDITCPIIFTTAYDEYALKAFDVNGISYLLKPINKTDLEKAINKYKSLTRHPVNNSELIAKLMGQMGGMTKTYKSGFLVSERDKLVPLPVSSIACVFIDTKMIKAVTHDKRSYYLNHNLDEVMGQLDPVLFFKANRQYIVARSAIKDISVWFGGKLLLNLFVDTPEKIVVSKAKAGELKTWLLK